MNPAFNTQFARLYPADRSAHLAFDRIASKIKAEPAWNEHARNYIVINDEKNEIEYIPKERESESESEGGSGPEPQKRSIWRGYYQLDFDVPPMDPRQGWILGGGKFAPDDESPELVLTERKVQESVHSRHARLAHNYSSGALVLHLADKCAATVDGKEICDSIIIWSSDTLLTFGTLHYRLRLDNPIESMHRLRLSRYQQIHGLGVQTYPVTLLSTPAKSDYIHNDYIIKNPVGHGNSSVVFAAVHLNTSAVVAIKRVLRRQENAGQIEREIEMASLLGRHQRLGQLVDKMTPDGDRRAATFRANNFDEVYLVYSPLAITTWMHLCTAGSTTDSHNEFCTTIFWQCLEGIEYIHAQGIIHRDIKPESLAITSLRPPQSRVINFGSATRSISTHEPGIGTLQYLAPEMQRILRSGNASCVDIYDNKIDIFAFGLSACQIFCKRLATWGEPNDEVLADLKEGIRAQQGAPSHVKKLIRSMLVDDADLRPSAEKVIKAPDTWDILGA